MTMKELTQTTQARVGSAGVVRPVCSETTVRLFDQTLVDEALQEDVVCVLTSTNSMP